ncbi:hypothetical protein EJ03DRAFT_329026 [Teratosphaeria nubilosa]|uniref:Secreted protein n=1 Tax=Teratosphaeria nubilosa TaxID=161662 RepID=A0A6G1L440_9PEZI|nr:hypothetical protein EJ03DRAFT_329026 [Teratosphaeria nubilosa]
MHLLALLLAITATTTAQMHNTYCHKADWPGPDTCLSTVAPNCSQECKGVVSPDSIEGATPWRPSWLADVEVDTSATRAVILLGRILRVVTVIAGS